MFFGFGLRVLMANKIPRVARMMIMVTAGIIQSDVEEFDVLESVGWVLVGEVVSLGEPVVTGPRVGVG